MHLEDLEWQLDYCMQHLNDYDVGELEARASENYLRSVSETIQNLDPITFRDIKNIVTTGNPPKWDRYCRPERQPKAMERDCGPSFCQWRYKLYITKSGSEDASALFFFYTPFSYKVGSEDEFYFDEHDFERLAADLRNDGKSGDPRRFWSKIKAWQSDLQSNTMELSGDRPGTELYTVMEWWRNFDPDSEAGPLHTSMAEDVSKQENAALQPPGPKSKAIRSHNSLQAELGSIARFPPIIEDVGTSEKNALSWMEIECEPAKPPSPCQCLTCKRSLHINVKAANISSQTRIESEPAELSSSSRRQTRYPERSSPKIEDYEPQFTVQSAVAINPVTPLKGWLENEPTESSSSYRCQTRYYPERSSPKMEDNDHQFAVQSAMVNDSATPLKGRLGLFKSKLEEEEPRPQVTPLPLRYSNNTDENARPLVPLRKKQKIHHVSTLQPRIEEHPLPATESSPLQGQPRILKRKIEEVEPRPQIAPLPRRYRNNTDEDAQPATLGPVRKRLKTSLRGPIITKNDEVSTESDTGSEDAMSVDEDFLTANSKLSHLTIGN